MKARIILLLVVFLSLMGCRSRTTRQPSVTIPTTDMQFPGESALRTGSAEAFGRAISQQILIDAASQMVKGKPGPVTVHMKFDVDINSMSGPGLSPERLEIPPIPTEEEIMGWDFCWIICDSKTTECYADCSYPRLSSGGFRTCVDVWRDYYECQENPLCKTKYISELIRLGCVQARKVKIEIGESIPAP